MNKMTAWMKGLLLLTLMVGGQAGAEVETVTYLHTDHLGSPIMGRDASGNTVFREEYGPWGQQLNATTPSDDVTYTGHASEGDIGLTYMKARWYDPAVGRFLSPDPVTFDGGGAGYLKRYAYVHNNPYSNIDPDGEAVGAAVLAVGVWMVGGAAISGGMNALLQFDQSGSVQIGGIGGVADAAGDGALLGPFALAASGRNTSSVTVQRSRHPESAQHIEGAIAAGQPRTLTLDRANAASRRREALRNTEARSGFDRDEFPPAMFREGGEGASVRHISPGDNRGAGACIGAQCRDLPDGARVRINVTD